MAFSRRILWSVASGSLIYSGMASALGMGEITLHSALNQPLNADIQLVDAGNLSASDIRVMLASADDFQRIGVDRLAFLQDLRFVPIVDASGSRIRVYSEKPVREPYLNFIVEVARTKSRLLREYTVLLDPLPSMPAMSAPVAAVMPSPNVPARPQPAAVVPATTMPAASGGQYHQVASGESLWTIAGQLAARAGQASQSQLMQDILALNPEAFAGGDAARLRAGARLLLPDYLEGAAAAQAEAVASEAVEASEPTPEPLPSEPTVAEDQVAALRRQLFEELAASREENELLRQSLVEMQAQLELVNARLADQQSVVASPAAVVTAAMPPENQALPAAEGAAAAQSPSTSTPAAWWGDWALPASGLAALLGLFGLLYGRRRKKATAEQHAEPAERYAQPVPTVRAPAALVAHALSDMPRQPAHASVSETDVLEAADIYLTYGRREDALDVLMRGIDKAPEQLELRLRLLGLLAESGDVDSYRREAAAYRDAGGSAANLDQLLALHPAMAAAFAQLEQAEPTPPEDEEFVLDLDALADLEDEQTPASSREDEAVKTPTQAWLDDFDEPLTLDELPSLLDQSGYEAPELPAIEHLEPNPEHLVRLNQALAYIQQGHIESACVILESLANEGDEAQRQQVTELLARIA